MSLPCAGCGYCCTETMCRIGSMLYGHYMNPCPSLTWNGERYVCSLYLQDPERYEEFLRIGEGCYFPTNPRRRSLVGCGDHALDAEEPYPSR